MVWSDADGGCLVFGGPFAGSVASWSMVHACPCTSMLATDTPERCKFASGANSPDVWLLKKVAATSDYSWSQVAVVNPTAAPGHARLHSAVIAPIEGNPAMLVYGGITSSTPKQLLYAFFPHNGTWTTRANGPGSNGFVRYGHTAVWAKELSLMLARATVKACQRLACGASCFCLRLGP